MHNQFLLAALKQAKSMRGLCAPNPSVGAVAVQNEKIIAQACHQGAGTPHAEQVLLTQFPPKTPGVSVYVTLEPCNHWGRTPPCVDALVNHGIERVIYGYTDPNLVVAENDTPGRLRSHGIQVYHHPLPEINEFYRSYHYWSLTGKPWVTVKMAVSMDGKIAGIEGKRAFLSNSQCAEFTHLGRSNSDVILTSAKTLIQDNPLLNVRLEETENSRILAIVDSRLETNPKLQAIRLARGVHIYHDAQIKDDRLQKYPENQLHGLPTQRELLDLKAVISHLGEMGYHDVWVEAGGKIFSVLHKLGLVNRTYLYIVPTFLGEEATTVYPDALTLQYPCKIQWQNMGDNMIACMDWEEANSCLPV